MFGGPFINLDGIAYFPGTLFHYALPQNAVHQSGIPFSKCFNLRFRNKKGLLRNQDF